MRLGLLAVTALLSAAPSVLAADAPLPPIVIQSQPIGRVFDDLRSAANIIGGEKAVKALNEGLKNGLGEKGLEGIDMGRPFVGYVVLAPKPTDITAVFAFPISTEKDFLDLCERINHQKPKLAGKEKDLYELPPLDPRYKALMRFHERYAYIAYGANPNPHIDPKALVPMAKLYDPAEKGLVSARLHFDRISLAVKLALPALAEEVKKTLFSGGGVGDQETELMKPALKELEKLMMRYVALAAGADTITARVLFDLPAGNFVAEAVLASKPDSELSRLIAAFAPTGNKFGALLTHPETAVGMKLRLPLFEPEIRNAAVLGLEVAEKEGLKTAPPNIKPLAEEVLKGLARTVKTGEFDIVAAVRGPDKNDWYTAVGAIAFEDTAKLEKEFKAYIEKEVPEVADAIKWNAAKVGNVNIHTWKFPNGWFIDPTKFFGGDDCTVAVAFAPQGIFLVMGPDSIGTLKDMFAIKPVPSPVLEVVLNPARLMKAIKKINPNDPDNTTAEHILGTEDKLLSAFSLTLEGGKELKAAIKIDLKLGPRAILYTVIERVMSEKPMPMVDQALPDKN